MKTPHSPTPSGETLLQSDVEILTFIKSTLRVPVVCDILDDLGLHHQAMHQRLRPLLPDVNLCGFVGRARTARWMETDHVVESNPYGSEIDLMDSLKPNDIVVHSTDYAGTNAPWGELMSIVAMKNGAAGCICDSQVRDCRQIIKLGFPVYCAGIRPVNSKGRGIVVDYDTPVRCGGVLVRSGDLVFADYDGIVVVPREAEERVLCRALDRTEKEEVSRRELLQGKTLQEVYSKYRVL
jgi:4-hydroxy-4-methyl-2-oxoglutarate aldolase